MDSMESFLTANCPEDGKQLYQFVPDDLAKDEVVCLAINCTFMDDGCMWRGKLGNLEMHVDRYHHNEQQGFANKTPILHKGAICSGEPPYRKHAIFQLSAPGPCVDRSCDGSTVETPHGAEQPQHLEDEQAQFVQRSPKLSPPPQHVCCEEFQARVQAMVQAMEEKLAVFSAALENEKRDRTRELAAQRNSFEAFHDECVAERERASNDRDMEVALLQNSDVDLEARVRRLERH